MFSDTKLHFKYRILAEKNGKKRGKCKSHSTCGGHVHFPGGHISHFYSPSLGVKHISDAFKVQAPPMMKSHQCSAGARPSGSFHIGLHKPTAISLRLFASPALEELFPLSGLQTEDWRLPHFSRQTFEHGWQRPSQKNPLIHVLIITHQPFWTGYRMSLPLRRPPFHNPVNIKQTEPPSRDRCFLIEDKWLIYLQFESR